MTTEPALDQLNRQAGTWPTKATIHSALPGVPSP
jgi:hypothetical protein